MATDLRSVRPSARTRRGARNGGTCASPRRAHRSANSRGSRLRRSRGHLQQLASALELPPALWPSTREARRVAVTTEARFERRRNDVAHARVAMQRLAAPGANHDAKAVGVKQIADHVSTPHLMHEDPGGGGHPPLVPDHANQGGSTPIHADAFAFVVGKSQSTERPSATPRACAVRSVGAERPDSIRQICWPVRPTRFPSSCWEIFNLSRRSRTRLLVMAAQTTAV